MFGFGKKEEKTYTAREFMEYFERSMVFLNHEIAPIDSWECENGALTIRLRVRQGVVILKCVPRLVQKPEER